LNRAESAEAAVDLTFNGFSLWQISPSDTGSPNFEDVGGGALDFELGLGPNVSVEHTIGVLSRDGAGTYVFTFDTSVEDADLEVSLLFDGEIALTSTAVYSGSPATFATVTFALSEGDMAQFSPGISTASLLITNTAEAPARLDNFAVTGATFETLEAIGAGQIASEDVFTLQGDPTVSVTSSADFLVNANAVLALADLVDLKIDNVDSDTGEFLWSFQAPASLFEIVPVDGLLTLDFATSFPTAGGVAIERTVSIGITGKNDAPEVSD
jgi:hypothetical protein